LARGLSVIFWNFSKRCPEGHSYSYVGIGSLTA
jgi:hypothetical protein